MKWDPPQHRLSFLKHQASPADRTEIAHFRIDETIQCRTDKGRSARHEQKDKCYASFSVSQI